MFSRVIKVHSFLFLLETPLSDRLQLHTLAFQPCHASGRPSVLIVMNAKFTLTFMETDLDHTQPHANYGVPVTSQT